MSTDEDKDEEGYLSDLKTRLSNITFAITTQTMIIFGVAICLWLIFSMLKVCVLAVLSISD